MSAVADQASHDADSRTQGPADVAPDTGIRGCGSRMGKRHSRRRRPASKVSQADRLKWDERYRTGSYAARPHPTRLLRERLADLPRGRALDVACGAGRNALFLAEAGFTVDAVDVSRAGLERGARTAAERGLTINWIETDLDSPPHPGALPNTGYALIVMVRYVNMPLIPALVDRLSEGGYFVCEQHLETTRDVAGPSDPAFRVRPNELLAAASDLRVLFYREGLVQDPDDRPAVLAQLMACRGTPRYERSDDDAS